MELEIAAGLIVGSFALLWITSLIKLLFIVPNSLSKSTTPFMVADGVKRNVLLVTAHPDDESMFFVPTIEYLASRCGHNIYVLCISAGNAEGKGYIRKEEILQACSVLKVPMCNVTVLDLPELQDGFDKPWSHTLLAEIIGRYVTSHDIDTIITFDDYGVSGHPQHCAVHFGVCEFLVGNTNLSQGEAKKTVDAWQLMSTSITRKYSGLLDIWYSVLYSLWIEKGESYCVFNKFPYTCFLAMGQHKSQWIWYRKLFVIFSSYTYINTLRKIRL